MKWFPEPIYKTLPYAYFLIGIVCLFLSFSSYSVGRVGYIFSGLLFTGAGLIVGYWRLKSRK